MSGSSEVRIVETSGLSARQRRAIRRLLERAFEGAFSEEDWNHTLGGYHALIHADGAIVAHGSAVERRIFIGDEPYRAGYVEAVAVHPPRQRAGLGSAGVGAAPPRLR